MTAIVMAHGAFCGGWAFERFAGPFRDAGFEVLAPDLRGHASEDAPDAVSGVSMADFAGDVAALCAAQSEPPVLIGHSMGGLVAQMAAARGAPVAGLVLLAPSPPWGVTHASLEEAATAFGVQMLGPFAAGLLEPDRDLMRRYSLDRMPKPDREAIVTRLRPESAVAVRQTLNWWLDPFMTTSLGPGSLPAPSLVIGGARDVVHSEATVRAVAARIGAAVRVMPDMSHWLVGEPGWEDVAAAALAWIAERLSLAA